MATALTARLVRDYGAPSASIINLRSVPGPAHVNYFGLVDVPGRGADLVIEHQGQALLYVVDGTTLGDAHPDEIEATRRRLAMRADATYLAVAFPGRLQVYDLGLDRSRHVPAAELTEPDPTFVPRIASGDLVFDRKGKTAHDFLLALLKETTTRLREDLRVPPREVIALVGRALFLRFLVDRQLLKSGTIESIAPGKSSLDLLSDPVTAAAASRWLDETFNGDLLTLPQRGSEEYFKQFAGRQEDGGVFTVLSAILGLDEPVGGAYQRRLQWNEVDFAYVPVGLLSEVYEAHVHKFELEQAKRSSVYYTPRRLAEFMTAQAFMGLRVPADRAVVLDPSCGAGVFLVTAFRRLVQEAWRASGVQPKTPEIRKILNEQIRGFDLNASALQLSALALYLTALELDPDPRPGNPHLKFSPLLGNVLHNVGSWDQKRPMMGSLAPVPELHRGVYDLVIGNPPWTAWPAEYSEPLSALTRSCARDRNIEVPEDYVHPDQVPDVAFLWQATRWCKPHSPIALAMAGRLLFKTSAVGSSSRDLLLQGIRVTGILNGAELRNTNVWPKVTAPFCLLFAVNEKPSISDAFMYLSPRLESALNQQGRLRVDSSSAHTVRIGDVVGRPHAFKTLFKGDALDLELLDRLRSSSKLVRLGDYLQRLGVAWGEGFQTTASSTPTPEWLSKLKVFPVDCESATRGALVERRGLQRYAQAFTHRSRREAIYQGPLVLLHQSPSRDLHNVGRRQAFLSSGSVAFSERFVGFSTSGRPEAERLAAYLFCVLSSNFLLYHQLMTSVVFGVERDVLTVFELNDLPMLPLEDLSRKQLAFVDRVGSWISQPSARDWRALDAFVVELLGLSRVDGQLIADRLATRLPFSAHCTLAQQPPTTRDAEQFAAALGEQLGPFASPPSAIDVDLLPNTNSPWCFLRLHRQVSAALPELSLIEAATVAADLFDASQIEVPGPDQLLVGILKQRRYWSASAARALALSIMRNHVTLLDGD